MSPFNESSFNGVMAQRVTNCPLLYKEMSRPRELFSFFFKIVFETGFLCVALAILELALYSRLTSNSQKVKGVSHNCPAVPCSS